MSESSFLKNLLGKYSKPSEELKTQKSEEKIDDIEVPEESYAYIDHEVVEDNEDLDEYYDILLNEDTIFKEKVIETKRTESAEEKGSARKMFTPSKAKKEKKEKKTKKKLQEFYDPFNSLKDFKADSNRIKNEIQESLKNEGDDLNNQMTKLGLKSCKTLGNAKSKKEMNHFLEYLEKGSLPQEYIDKLQSLISE